jgi:hypothetical protein
MKFEESEEKNWSCTNSTARIFFRNLTMKFAKILNYSSLRPITLHVIGNLVPPFRKASLATASVVPSISKIIFPGRTSNA